LPVACAAMRGLCGGCRGREEAGDRITARRGECKGQ
jgi:hypothetical protein